AGGGHGERHRRGLVAATHGHIATRVRAARYARRLAGPADEYRRAVRCCRERTYVVVTNSRVGASCAASEIVSGACRVRETHGAAACAGEGDREFFRGRDVDRR